MPGPNKQKATDAITALRAIAERARPDSEVAVIATALADLFVVMLPIIESYDNGERTTPPTTQ